MPDTRSEVINLFGENIGEKLIGGGLSSLTAIMRTSDKDILKIKGIGNVTLAQIREEAPLLDDDFDELLEKADVPDPPGGSRMHIYRADREGFLGAKTSAGEFLLDLRAAEMAWSLVSEPEPSALSAEGLPPSIEQSVRIRRISEAQA